MTDSNCTREAYDQKTQRYKVPKWTPPVPPRQSLSINITEAENEDQCPSCRCAPGHPHNADCPEAEAPVNVPLPLQTRLLDAFLFDEWVEALTSFINAHRGEVVELAHQRLKEGYPSYRSRMYGWSPEQRTDEALEEVADLVNYLSSGEVE